MRPLQDDDRVRLRSLVRDHVAIDQVVFVDGKSRARFQTPAPRLPVTGQLALAARREDRAPLVEPHPMPTGR